MQQNVPQQTIEPIIRSCVSEGTRFYSDEYDIDSRLTAWGSGNHAIAGGQVPSTRRWPRIRHGISEAQLTRLSPAEAQVLGQALTACLLQPDGFQPDSSAGETA